jgi:peptidyl-prolyl cis-trans isomerase SurA
MKSLTTFSIYILLITLNFFIKTAVASQLLDYIVAVVNDDVIVNTELQQGLQTFEKNLQQQGIEMPPSQEMEKQVLNHLILTKLQLQLAKNTGILVEDTHLNEQVRKMAAKKKMDLPAFRQEIEQQGYDYEQWREQLRNHLIMEHLQQRYITSRIQITKREIDNFIANQGQQESTDEEYHLLHILISTPGAPSPEEIETKRQKALTILDQLKQGADFRSTAVAVSDSVNRFEGGDLGWRKLGTIPTLFNSVVQEMTVGEIRGPFRNASGFHLIKLIDQRGGEATLITQTKVRQILIKTSELVSDFEAENRLQALKFRLEQGDDFAQLAQANSQDSLSAVEGGLIGWVNQGEMPPEFETVMEDLAENQISEPFKSRQGWHLIQVLTRRQYDNTEQARRTKALEQIHKRKAEEELQAWRQQLFDEAYIEYRSRNLEEDLS